MEQFQDVWWSFPCSSEVGNVEVMYNICLYDIPRFVHAFTSAGILPSQYLHFSKFASIGIVGKWYIQQGLYVLYIRYLYNLYVSIQIVHTQYIGLAIISSV